jgi:D-xylose 1-dehydrogenase (NADP+, D-xylono-1,5-lactone-forming)
MTEMKFGILGAARIAAGALIPAIKKASNAQVAAVAARDAGRAASYASEHGIPKSYGSYDEMLADPEIEAVYNPLPNSEHMPWTIRALEAGKHVICEKSFTLNAAEAEQIAAASRRTGKQVMEAFMWRLHPQVQQVKDIIASGKIGDLKLMRSSFSFMMGDQKDIRMVKSLGGGALYDIGTYCVSGFRCFTGREPLSVTAQQNLTPSSHVAGGGIDLDMTGVLDFGDGLRGIFDCSFAQPFIQRFEIIGSAGTITLLDPWVPGRDKQGRDMGHGGAAPNLLLNGEDLPSVAADQYQLMVEHFVRGARGEEALKYPVADSIKQMKVLDALFASAGGAGEVKL